MSVINIGDRYQTPGGGIIEIMDIKEHILFGRVCDFRSDTSGEFTDVLLSVMTDCVVSKHITLIEKERIIKKYIKNHDF